MRRQRVTKHEIDAALREHGYADLSAVSCVVLETDGSLSVVRERGPIQNGENPAKV
jgi:uncharacterized membrane protein YcaP (DUF421 family)